MEMPRPTLLPAAVSVAGWTPLAPSTVDGVPLAHFCDSSHESVGHVVAVLEEDSGRGPLTAFNIEGRHHDEVALASGCIAAVHKRLVETSGDSGRAREVNSPLPPWAVADAHGRTLLSICVHTADGEARPVVNRGSSLPARGEVLLTSAQHGASSITASLLVGARPAASACRQLLSLRLPIAPSDRGLAQLLLAVVASSERLSVVLRDVQTGRCVCGTLDAAAAADEAADGCGDAEASSAGARTTTPTTSGGTDCTAPCRPAVWRFETPYTSGVHPGFCCAGGRFIAIPQPTSVSARRVEDDGEVDAASTAERVWPGAYLLATYLQQVDVAGRIRGASVLELGAGLGVPGLAAWAGGASEVLLTDLRENLPRLAQAVGVNGASATVAVEALDWMNDSLPETLTSRPKWDFVLAADCVYCAPAPPASHPQHFPCTSPRPCPISLHER
jgi:hypothetical protein